jgi:hypothetical protein
MEWGSSFDVDHIVIVRRNQHAKSEVVVMKNDSKNGKLMKYEARLCLFTKHYARRQPV